jgi:hypothetical protein
MNNKILLSALAMDLKRVALGLHRRSYTMAERFLQEAIKRKNEIKKDELLPYMQTIMDRVEKLKSQDNVQNAEDILMYSTRIQNYVLFFC